MNVTISKRQNSMIEREREKIQFSEEKREREHKTPDREDVNDLILWPTS